MTLFAAQISKMRRITTLGSLALAMALVACQGTGSAPEADSPSAPLDAASDPTVSAPLSGGGPPPPPAGAFLAQMPPEQTSQLTSLGVEVVVPGQVPPSFSIAEMRVDRAGPGYLVVYQNSSGQCFAVEFVAEGMDDPPTTENRLPIQPPLFGDQAYGLNYGPFNDADLRAKFPQSNLFTDWLMGGSGGYRLIGATYIGELFESLQGCKDIAPEEAVALAESLTVLTGDPMDDPMESKP